MSLKHSEEFVRFTDKVIYAGLGLQLFILILFVFGGLFSLFWINSRGSQEVIEAGFARWESQLTESIYMNSITGLFELQEIPAVLEFEKSLRASGREVEVSVGSCEATTGQRSVFALSLGLIPLEHCIRVDQSRAPVFRQASLISAFAILAVLLSLLLWWLWRGRIRQRYVQPLIFSFEKEAQDAAVGKMASQIAHDIRSPLAALNVFLRDVHTLPEDRRNLLRAAVHRIHDIANNLLPKKKSLLQFDEGPKVELLSSLLDSLVTEKRIQYRHKNNLEIIFKLSRKAYDSFSLIESVSFLRAISNLIDNAVEASDKEFSTVTVSLGVSGDFVVVQVEDNGRGIPVEMLSQVFKRGVSLDKEDGSGLGLAHAKATVESFGGHIGILSKENEGTRLTIRLKKAESPSWFLKVLELPPSSRVAIVDDDSSIHRIWEGRLMSIRAGDHGIEAEHFWSTDQLQQAVQKSGSKAFDLILMDYEFVGESTSGLDWIRQYDPGRRAILVTSRYEEGPLRAQCERLGVRIIPKGLSPYIPISVQGEGALTDRQEEAM
jgi:signal transduction histidine kinase/CheY-like chemotaxis protein